MWKVSIKTIKPYFHCYCFVSLFSLLVSYGYCVWGGWVGKSPQSSFGMFGWHGISFRIWIWTWVSNIKREEFVFDPNPSWNSSSKSIDFKSLTNNGIWEILPQCSLASSLPQAATTMLKPQPPWCSGLSLLAYLSSFWVCLYFLFLFVFELCGFHLDFSMWVCIYW